MHQLTPAGFPMHERDQGARGAQGAQGAQGAKVPKVFRVRLRHPKHRVHPEHLVHPLVSPLYLTDVPEDVGGREIGELEQRERPERERNAETGAALGAERCDRLRQIVAAGAKALERHFGADDGRRLE